MSVPSPSATPLHAPLPAAMRASQLTAFTQALSAATGRQFADAQALQEYCIAEFREFWRFFAQWCGGPLGLTGSALPVCEGDDCEHARFFPHLRLNYAASLLNLQVAHADAPALTACHADGRRTRWTRGQLRAQVNRLADVLADLGVGPGDPVVALVRNDDRAIVAALAVAALGATLSTASPDMSVQAIAERFEPLAPRLLLAHAAAQPFDQGPDLPTRIEQIAARLSGLRAVVRLDGAPLAGPWLQRSFDELPPPGEVGADAPAPMWPRYGFNHPLFVMFSSGTTGRPKCIVHGAGGSLLEHVKEHRLHTDLRPGDRLYFHTSCSWMMWNWQLSALASGVEIVTYDGPVLSVDRLWQLVADERVTVFGTSPAYLRMCQDAGLEPAWQHELGALRAILSTGAVLHDSQFEWVRRHVGAVPLQSISGGTDILGCFVLGHPHLPVFAGQAQCRSLGLDVQAWRDGAPAEGIGELVCTNPFPSRPLGFHDDAGGERFHAAYFSQNPGVWTHGDLIEFTPQGGARLHGRSDGVLNVRGIKFAPVEIYRVLADIDSIRGAMVVPWGTGEGRVQRIVALLVLAEGVPLDGELVARVRREIARRLSSAHVPDIVIDVPELPVTHSGKASEAAARCAVNALPVGNEAALRNPECLAAIRTHPGLRLQDEPPCAWPQPPGEQPLQERLLALWRRHLGNASIGADDHFFELGGNSLLAAVLLAQVQAMTGRALPLAVMLQAPTVRQLVRLIEADAPAPVASTLVRMRAGTGHPLFLVHGLSGTVMECWSLVESLRDPRPVCGLQAHGVDGERLPQDRVVDMAASYVEAIRQEQPHGPYAVCGFSFGGAVALEIARQLTRAGEEVQTLCLLDTQVHRPLPRLVTLWVRSVRAARKWARLPAPQRRAYLAERVRRVFQEIRGQPSQGGLRPAQWAAMSPAQQRVYDAMIEALEAYLPGPYDGSPIVYVRSRVPLEGYFNPMPVWRRVARAGLRVVDMPGAHLDLVRAHARHVAAVVDQALAQSGPVTPPGGRP